MAEDAPLFAIVANHHRINRIDFGLGHVRLSVRRIATDPYLPGNYLIKWNRSVRGRASELTSAQTYNGDWNLAVAQLTQDCCESSAILIDTMMVLWSRLQEGRGMQWKKALLALQILRNLLLNGPINAIAEVTDGFASICILKLYAEALRAQNSKLVRDVAVEIYSLVVDLPVLFARRRELMNQCCLAKDPKPSPLRKETRMIKGIGQFHSIHIALCPAGATVAPTPTPVNDLLFQKVPSAAPTGTANVPASGVSQSGNYSSDLLSWSVAPTPLPQVAASNNNTAVGGRQMPQTNAPTPTNYSSDLLALSFAPSPSPQVAAPNNAGVGEPQQPDPFTMQEMSQAVSPKAVPPPAAKDPLSQPTSDLPSLSFGTSPSPQITTANNAENGEQKKPDPFSMQASSPLSWFRGDDGEMSNDGNGFYCKCHLVQREDEWGADQRGILHDGGIGISSMARSNSVPNFHPDETAPTATTTAKRSNDNNSDARHHRHHHRHHHHHHPATLFDDLRKGGAAAVWGAALQLLAVDGDRGRARRAPSSSSSNFMRRKGRGGRPWKMFGVGSSHRADVADLRSEFFESFSFLLRCMCPWIGLGGVFLGFFRVKCMRRDGSRYVFASVVCVCRVCQPSTQLCRTSW
jgi:hypothetical protein